MNESNRDFIFPEGTKVVTTLDVMAPNGKLLQPKGAVGIVICAPNNREHSYRIRFLDGIDTSLRHDQMQVLSHFKDEISVNTKHNDGNKFDSALRSRVILRCVVGSRAFGLETEDSDTDRRGIYLPSADDHWSLAGVPEQLENHETQETYWEIQKFIRLALKSNPNVLECLYSPIVEHATSLGEEILSFRDRFLSKLVFQTYSGYVASQFKKMQIDLRNHGSIKWKHAMHLIRLLISGIEILKTGNMIVNVREHRDRLLEIKSGNYSWDQVEKWRLSLQKIFQDNFETTSIPERPDYSIANELLIKARRLAQKNQLP